MKKTIVLALCIFASVFVQAAQNKSFDKSGQTISKDKKDDKKDDAKKKDAKKKKAKAEDVDVTGTLAKKGKKFVLTTEDGTAYTVSDKKKAAEVEALDGKKVKVVGKAKAAKKGKTINKITSIEEV